MRIEEIISSELGVPLSLIESAVQCARSRVKKFNIPKKSGGFRSIYHPSKKLKVVQYWLMNRVLSELPVHPSAYAYKKGQSILENAKAHSTGRYFLRIDFRDFFSSIEFTDLRPILEDWHARTNPDWILDAGALSLFRQTCFYTDDRLAVGFPTSPVISNIVMWSFDSQLSSIVQNGDFGNAVYTRYADDLVISTDQVGACRRLIPVIGKLVDSIHSPRLAINDSKTRLGSSSGGTASVTGLRVCSDGHITINKKYKSEIRLLLSLFAQERLNKEETKRLAGHLSYCRHVAPQFYSGLAKRYFTEINSVLGSSL